MLLRSLIIQSIQFPKTDSIYNKALHIKNLINREEPLGRPAVILIRVMYQAYVNRTETTTGNRYDGLRGLGTQTDEHNVRLSSGRCLAGGKLKPMTLKRRLAYQVIDSTSVGDSNIIFTS